MKSAACCLHLMRVTYVICQSHACRQQQWNECVAHTGAAGVSRHTLVCAPHNVPHCVCRHSEICCLNWLLSSAQFLRQSPLRAASPLGTTTDVKWSAVKVGMVLKVLNDEDFPADLLCLYCSLDDNVCYIKTTNLDGERCTALGAGSSVKTSWGW